MASRLLNSLFDAGDFDIEDLESHIDPGSYTNEQRMAVIALIRYAVWNDLVDPFCVAVHRLPSLFGTDIHAYMADLGITESIWKRHLYMPPSYTA